MFGVVWIGVGFENTSFENNGRRVSVHLVPFFFALCVLCSNISDEGIEPGMYIFDIVFAHDLLVDDGGVLLLLGKLRLKEEQLRGHKGLEN